MEKEALPRLAEKFKALAHPVRLDIVMIIGELEAASGGTLYDQAEVSKSDLTRHLRILERARIITRHRDGTRHIFTLTSRSLPDTLSKI